MAEYEVERALRDAVASTIYSGTSEMQRNIIARWLGLLKCTRRPRRVCRARYQHKPSTAHGHAAASGMLARSTIVCVSRMCARSAASTSLSVRPTTSTSDSATTWPMSARSRLPMCGRCCSMNGVGAEQTRKMHFRVVDQQREALADEMLGQQNQRAFAQVVGAGLEGESYHADAALAACQHLGDRVVDVRAIRLHDAACIGTSTSRCLAMCIVARRSLAGTTRQTRSPASDSGRDIELRSLQTRSITSNAIDTQRFAHRAVSFANVIFSAWKLLQQYLTISAARIDVV